MRARFLILSEFPLTHPHLLLFLWCSVALRSYVTILCSALLITLSCNDTGSTPALAFHASASATLRIKSFECRFNVFRNNFFNGIHFSRNSVFFGIKLFKFKFKTFVLLLNYFDFGID